MRMSLEDTTVKLNRFSRTAVALAAGALLLTACGSDDNTGTTDDAHMRADLEVFDFRLGPEEVEQIDRLALP